MKEKIIIIWYWLSKWRGKMVILYNKNQPAVERREQKSTTKMSAFNEGRQMVKS